MIYTTPDGYKKRWIILDCERAMGPQDVDQSLSQDISKPVEVKPHRDLLFISKATPGDDEFVLWLAPKLEASGYKVFADILNLEPGERWRRSLTDALQIRAVKMLLCCSDTTLAKEGVLEEIGIASDLAKELNDPKFIIPLRIKPYKKIFGIGELQYVNFVRGWSEGTSKLLQALKRQHVPRDDTAVTINPAWEAYRRKGSILLKQEPERLTSNWMRITNIPDKIKYLKARGSIDRNLMQQVSSRCTYPAAVAGQGMLSFDDLDRINADCIAVGKFEIEQEIDLLDLVQNGSPALDLKRQDASNIVVSMLRQSWNAYCKERGLLEYQYSQAIGFHASDKVARIGQRIPWGKQGEHRSSMLRNVARGYAWQFGVTAIPSFWPYPHFKIKPRVLFSKILAGNVTEVILDAKVQHRLRRSICKGWRNKQWLGRLMAFIELLSGESSQIALQIGSNAQFKIEASPVLFTSPVSTDLPNVMTDEDEEADTSTLGRPDIEEEV